MSVKAELFRRWIEELYQRCSQGIPEESGFVTDWETISSSLQQELCFWNGNLLLIIIILITWQWTPFFFLIIFAGLQNMSQDVMESAQIEGANRLQTLIWIEIPIIKPHIYTAMTLGLINILKVFGLVYVTTQGGPGYKSANLPYLTYRTVFYNWSIGSAATLAVITVAITLILTQKFFKSTNTKLEEAEL